MVAFDTVLERFQRGCRSAAKIGRRCLAPALDAERLVIFVAGQQRSGTNMLMDVLERHWRTDVYHETDPRAFDQFQMRDLATIKTLVARANASHVVVKALCESQRLRDLLDAFPRARALWLVRDHHDVSESMARQFSTTAKVLKQMCVNPASGGWRSEGMSASVRTLMDDCVHDDITEISAAAFQWFMRNQLYFDQALHGDRRVKLIFYEDLATDPEPMFKRIMADLDLNYHPSLIADVSGGSVSKADKPPIDPRIDALCRQLHSRLAIAAQTQF